MRLIKKQNGYTIVELLIVTAVTGGLFLSASFLISGQIQKAQYRQDMQIVEQSIRNVVDNVNNGTFGEIPGQNGTSLDRMRIGMRFWFCADGAAVGPAIPECNPPASNDSGSIMHVETVVSGPPSVEYLADNTVRIPNGLKFMHWKGIGTTGTLTGPSKEFGTSVLFHKPDGNAVTSLTDSVAGVQYYSRSGTAAAHELSNIAGLERGVILCFNDGSSRWGSIEFGGANSGFNTTLNLEDKARCNP